MDQEFEFVIIIFMWIQAVINILVYLNVQGYQNTINKELRKIKSQIMALELVTENL